MPNLDSSRLTRAAQREQLDLVQALNQAALRDAGGTHEGIEGMISAYELAFRMQDTLPEVIDVAKEPESIRDLYGLDDEATSAFGRQCLAARRMAEAGVRFIEVGFGGWDTHRNLREELTSQCTSIDRPIAGLLTDLAQRGLLEDTLVIWGGEFGRTPDAQGTDGRDHNNKGFSMWMAGGGVQGGMVYGATDPLGREAEDGRMHIHDWHATILHMLGLNHERLTYQHAGRDFRLTDVHGEVAKEPESIRDLYGLDDEATSAFGRQCLAARRMAEAGVRFIEVGFGGWDTHRNLREELTSQCTSIDRPIAGLLTDLAQRGLLEDTLVIWGGEFGRTPDAQG
ncbi:MAG: DUF1501 domain-containing protein, partial [Planctomycetota bacterium]|nr:DUF1501 domain-containing protein [Planctomycetota bacterium]